MVQVKRSNRQHTPMALVEDTNLRAPKPLNKRVPVAEGLYECPVCFGGVTAVIAHFTDSFFGISQYKSLVLAAHKSGGVKGTYGVDKCAGSYHKHPDIIQPVIPTRPFKGSPALRVKRVNRMDVLGLIQRLLGFQGVITAEFIEEAGPLLVTDSIGNQFEINVRRVTYALEDEE